MICDVGSRDALEGIALFKALDAKYLHVFEPNPVAAELCRSNLSALLPKSRYSLNQVAVSDSSGPVKFHPVDTALSENKDIGFSSLFPINPEYTARRGRIVQQELVVEAVTLDDYFANHAFPPAGGGGTSLD